MNNETGIINPLAGQGGDFSLCGWCCNDYVPVASNQRYCKPACRKEKEAAEYRLTADCKPHILAFVEKRLKAIAD
tara:strand:+ start:4206 stop:4430 length:225 start_codon:yes stop_codon:yes gene_type:complete